MTDLIQWKQSLREEVTEGGVQFAGEISSQLISLREHAGSVLQVLPGPTDAQSVASTREAIVSNVLPRYRALVESAPSPATMGASFRSWMESLEAGSRNCPEALITEEPERLYGSSPADGPVTTIRKGAVRLGRRIRKPQSPPERTVPTFQLRTALIREWLPVQFGKVIDDDSRQLARHLGLIEKAISDVVYAALRADNRWRLVAEHANSEELSDVIESEDGSPASQGSSDHHEAFESALDRLNDAMERARDRLSEAAEGLASAAADDVGRRIEQALIPFETEVDRSGSFMSDIPEVGQEVFERRLNRIDGRGEAWKEWQNRQNQRVAYLESLIDLREGLDRMVDTMERGASDHLIQPIRRRTAAVSARLAETESQLSSRFNGPSDGLFEQRTEAVRALGDEAVRRVQEELVTPIQDLSLLTRIGEENEQFVDQLRALVDALPEPFRMHPLSSDVDHVPSPDADARVVSLRDVARNGTSEVDLQRLEDVTGDAKEELKEALDALINLPSIVRFSFESATESSSSATADDRASSDEDADQLLTMMQESLQRTRDAIQQITEGIEEGAALLVHAYRVETLKAWSRIQERLQVEHQVGAYVMDVRSKLDAEAREAGQRMARLSRNFRILSERFLRRGHREARALIERGKEAVGTPAPTRASFHETALGLAELEQVLDGVPTVYRKLFSFQPLGDPDLMVGRDESITFIENQLHQFDLGMPQAAMLVGGPSSGRTSLLNVLQSRTLAQRSVRVLRFADQPASPQAMIQQLGEALELPISGAKDISEAAQLVMDQLDPESAPICMVEHLETLMLRGIGGYDLLVDILQLMSLTDSRIIWIGTISSFAWQIVRTADPDSAALVNAHTMNDLSRADLERLIMERHKKSGIPLVFSEPEEPSPLLRRKLRRVRSKDRRQQILKEAYFDRLFTQFGQNIQMGLLQWIRSVHMSDDGRSMLVAPTSALNLSFFSSFNLDQVFTLKALLEHGSLSPEEYAFVDRVPEDKALTLFETLGNALVIETVDRSEPGILYRHRAVETSRQYRIRPLFSHAVIRLLRERNVVH